MAKISEEFREFGVLLAEVVPQCGLRPSGGNQVVSNVWFSRRFLNLGGDTAPIANGQALPPLTRVCGLLSPALTNLACFLASVRHSAEAWLNQIVEKTANNGQKQRKVPQNLANLMRVYPGAS